MATLESTRTHSRPFAATGEAAPVVGRLGPWQLVRLLSESNLTRVYLARPSAESAPTDDDESDVPARPASYVVKMLRKEWWRDPQAIDMQRREAWVGSKVSHPNLLPVLSARVQEPPFYVVTPKIDGTTLAHLLADTAPLAMPLALWIARQTAEGLATLHQSAGMIHTDVNPSNIIVSPLGHATLIDFGLAQTLCEASQWQNRPLAGTLAYMAPEMVTSALAADTKSDVYSLGVTLYEMLTSHRPFEGDNPADLATFHRESKPADLRSHRSDVPPPLAELVQSMLAKDPLRRPSSAEALVARLIRLEIDSFALR